MDEKIPGLGSVIDMFRGEALMLIFLSGKKMLTTDEEKADLLCQCFKDAPDLSREMFLLAKEEIYRQHSNASAFLTDSPEDVVSRRDKIVLGAIEKYLSKAQE